MMLGTWASLMRDPCPCTDGSLPNQAEARLLGGQLVHADKLAPVEVAQALVDLLDLALAGLGDRAERGVVVHDGLELLEVESCQLRDRHVRVGRLEHADELEAGVERARAVLADDGRDVQDTDGRRADTAEGLVDEVTQAVVELVVRQADVVERAGDVGGAGLADAAHLRDQLLGRQQHHGHDRVDVGPLQRPAH